ncbi:hypothetical protein GCM10009665_10610 [Kitasatospora nipponensis]|uniref:Uncharacterized protein n=2 Tax=Kitasatospora nipponensis TaxID=258049 RepID=A0ABN1VW28_9ACTN
MQHRTVHDVMTPDAPSCPAGSGPTRRTSDSDSRIPGHPWPRHCHDRVPVEESIMEHLHTVGDVMTHALIAVGRDAPFQEIVIGIGPTAPADRGDIRATRAGGAAR